jgi:hypothetical protein
MIVVSKLNKYIFGFTGSGDGGRVGGWVGLLFFG